MKKIDKERGFILIICSYYNHFYDNSIVKILLLFFTFIMPNKRENSKIFSHIKEESIGIIINTQRKVIDSKI